MHGHPLVLCDVLRAEQFGLLGGTCRLFRDYEFWMDDGGIPWARRRLGGHCFAATCLGPGWVFDPYARQRRSQAYATRLAAVTATDENRHRRELEQVVRKLRLGAHSERLLWAIHRAVVTARTSVVRLPDFGLARAVWGQNQQSRPRHWRQNLLATLEGLAWLHLSEWAGEIPPSLGEATALLTYVADLRDDPQDACGEDCPGRDGPRHHHYLVNIGRGFLGVLEQFARPDDGSGVRAYAFPVNGPRGVSATLRKVGRTGRLVSVYLPARLGKPSSCAVFTARQHRLLQATVRETTRVARQRRRDPAGPEVIAGNRVRDGRGKAVIACPFLEPNGQYVGFNGNRKRKGLGYRLATPGGWLAKAGYLPTQVEAYLADLEGLAGPLGLTAVGLDPSGGPCHDLAGMQTLATSEDGRRTLERLHVRIYTGEDYLERWGTVFGWRAQAPESKPKSPDGTRALLAAMERQGISRRTLAGALGKDPSFLSKLLAGKKCWPDGLLVQPGTDDRQQLVKRLTVSGARLL